MNQETLVRIARKNVEDQTRLRESVEKEISRMSDLLKQAQKSEQEAIKFLAELEFHARLAE